MKKLWITYRDLFGVYPKMWWKWKNNSFILLSELHKKILFLLIINIDQVFCFLHILCKALYFLICNENSAYASFFITNNLMQQISWIFQKSDEPYLSWKPNIKVHVFTLIKIHNRQLAHLITLIWHTASKAYWIRLFSIFKIF